MSYDSCPARSVQGREATQENRREALELDGDTAYCTQAAHRGARCGVARAKAPACLPSMLADETL